MISPININGVRPTQGPSGTKDRDTSTSRVSGSSDAAEFSAAAVGRSESARLVELASADSEIRAECVEQAKQNLVDGLHRVQEIVEQVAASLTKYVA